MSLHCDTRKGNKEKGNDNKSVFYTPFISRVGQTWNSFCIEGFNIDKRDEMKSGGEISISKVCVCDFNLLPEVFFQVHSKLTVDFIYSNLQYH